MHIDLIFSPLEVSRCHYLKEKTSIIIDVLRASSTMLYAFNGFDNTTNVLKGVKQIKPAKDLETAFEMHKSTENQGYLLAGERGGFPPEGFHFGNSPDDFLVDKTNNQSLIMATTNGTKMLSLLSTSSNVLIGSFVNAKAVANKSLKLDKDIIIGCAGRENVSSLEDITCGGLIIKHILNISNNSNTNITLSDSARLSMITYESFHNELDILKESSHGRYLINIGFEKDLYPCSKKDIFNIVPVYNKGIITPEIVE